MTHDARTAGRQQQFLDVISRDEATRRFESALGLNNAVTAGVPAENGLAAEINHEHVDNQRQVEPVPLLDALNRVLADDVRAPVDVTTFDRSNVDGFAVRAADTVSATEAEPCQLKLAEEVIAPGRSPTTVISNGHAVTIATGAMVPRGADAVVMIEDTDLVETPAGVCVEIRKAAAAGQFVSYAGTDVAKGETVLRAFQLITSREVGVLAALGFATVEVFKRPRVAIISTGDEIVPPGEPLSAGKVYDSNAAILAAAVTELGCEPVLQGTVNDDIAQLRTIVAAALECDAVVMSGGTSKGAGDLSYQVVRDFNDPGIVAHGVALKPGKPVCLAVTQGKPFVVLPGFPTSAIFTFHEFVAPVLRRMAGRTSLPTPDVTATLPMRLNSDRGRLEYLLVSLVRSDRGLVAYPMGKGSGSVTTFSRADGFISIPQHTEIVEADSAVEVRLLSAQLEPADLVVMGSHCPGLDLILSELSRRGITTKTIWIGSTAGLSAARRGECDIAGVHLLDPKTDTYNQPFVEQPVGEPVELISGYRRSQGIVFRADDVRFTGGGSHELQTMLDTAISDPECSMVNRNAGSGTRILLDGLLNGRRPNGYAVQPTSHTAVVAAISQKRADWGMAIDSVVRSTEGLGFLPVRHEQYDFVVPVARQGRAAIKAFLDVLNDPAIQNRLQQLGCHCD